MIMTDKGHSAHTKNDQDFVRGYGEAARLLAHAVSGEMPLGMRLTLLRYAKTELAEAMPAADNETQVDLVLRLVDQILLAERRVAQEGVQ